MLIVLGSPVRWESEDDLAGIAVRLAAEPEFASEVGIEAL